jgi:hypothetical protein
MNNDPENHPFGVLFVEYIISDNTYCEPEYDEIEDLNIIIGENGEKIPYVEIAAIAGTKSETRVQKEAPDADPDTYNNNVTSQTLGTRTFTEVEKETSDADDIPIASLGTKTETFVKAEQPDTDPSMRFEGYYFQGTKTFTKEDFESTDSDDDLEL